MPKHPRAASDDVYIPLGGDTCSTLARPPRVVAKSIVYLDLPSDNVSDEDDVDDIDDEEVEPEATEGKPQVSNSIQTALVPHGKVSAARGSTLKVVSEENDNDDEAYARFWGGYGVM